MKNITLIATLLSLVATSCVKSLEDEGVFTVTTYTGTVVEKSSHQPIEGVDVSVTDGINVYAKTRTGSDGSFKLEDVDVELFPRESFLLLDGSVVGLPSKKGKLLGYGYRNYDYGGIALYDKTSTEMLPIVRLTNVGYVSSGNAECRGVATLPEELTGVVDITDRGFVWSTQQNPSLERGDSRISAGSGEGAFSANVTGLLSTVKYYIRGYAVNKFGTSYTEQEIMSSPYMSLPTFNYNGHTYKVGPMSWSEMNWETANSYCLQYSIDEITGWRLPTKEELVQMYASDLILYRNNYNTYFWSSTFAYTNYGVDYYYSIDGYSGSLYVSRRDANFFVYPIRQEN